MFVRALQAEWMKGRWWNIFPLLLLPPVYGALTGAMNTPKVANPAQHWRLVYAMSANNFAMWFLPLVTCVLVALLCRYEHKDGAWKQVLVLPIPRWQIYAAKFLIAVLLVIVMQALFLIGVIGLNHEIGAIPWKMLLTQCLARGSGHIAIDCTAIGRLLSLEKFCRSVVPQYRPDNTSPFGCQLKRVGTVVFVVTTLAVHDS